jgi:hypothetical protein
MGTGSCVAAASAARAGPADPRTCPAQVQCLQPGAALPKSHRSCRATLVSSEVQLHQRGDGRQLGHSEVREGVGIRPGGAIGAGHHAQARQPREALVQPQVQAGEVVCRQADALDDAVHHRARRAGGPAQVLCGPLAGQIEYGALQLGGALQLLEELPQRLGRRARSAARHAVRVARAR